MSSPSNIWLRVDVAPGADIEDTAKDAISLARRLGITVWFEFNGVDCGAGPEGDPAKLAQKFKAALYSSEVKIVCES